MVGGEKRRKKKKGRPSLLDLQKRQLKQQQHILLKKHNNINNNNNNNNKNNSIILLNNQQNNNTLSKNSNTNINTSNGNTKKRLSAAAQEEGKRSGRSTRRNPKPDYDDDVEEEEKDDDDDDVVGGGIEGGIEGKSRRNRKLLSVAIGSDGQPLIQGKNDAHHKVEKHSIDVTNDTNADKGSSKQEDGPLTPLPDKKLLLFILDGLQKKDTYGVFAEPVDEDELPDYHEIIEHPMDFSTVRKKLEDASYGSLEQFEKDIFLICSNAMQYNSPDTIYFRQACSIQELAKKNFDNLRQDSDDNELDPEPKVVRRGRPPKNLKRPLGRPPLVRANPDFSEASLATAGGTTNRSNSELRKGSSHPEKYGATDSFARSLLSSRNSEAYIGRPAERFERPDEMIGSSSKGISMKHGKRQIVLDENRRNTYKNSYAFDCRHEPSVLNTFRGERKQLIAVGLHTQYGYARSLARFAAKLGPVAWKVASRKIERCVPSGIKFGPGWIGENEAPSEKPLKELPGASAPTQGLVESSGDTSEKKPQEHMPAVPTKLNNELTKAISTPGASKDSSSVSSAENSGQVQQSPTIQSHVNGVNGNCGLKFSAQTEKKTVPVRPSILDLQASPSIVTPPKTEPHSSCPPATDNNGYGEVANLPANLSTIKEFDGSAPPDLNVGFQSPRSSGSGKTDSGQPDLALQL